MEELCNLLFELSSSDRLSILLELRKTPLKLSHVSKKLSSTPQETSRNISRLYEAKLIAKDNNASFHLTSYGEQILKLLPGIEFLTKHREYFATHTISALPPEFTASLATLASCELTNELMVALHNVENMIREANEFVWIMSDQVLVSTVPHLIQALERGAEFKLILPRKISFPRNMRERLRSPVFVQAQRVKKLEGRFLEKVDAVICMSEKEVASLSFPNMEGRFDYLGFRAKDEWASKWSRDLYSYYWSIATPQTPDQLISG